MAHKVQELIEQQRDNKRLEKVGHWWFGRITATKTRSLHTVDGAGKLSHLRIQVHYHGTQANSLEHDKDNANVTVTADDASSERKLTAKPMPFDAIQVSKDFVVTRS